MSWVKITLLMIICLETDFHLNYDRLVQKSIPEKAIA